VRFFMGCNNHFPTKILIEIKTRLGRRVRVGSTDPAIAQANYFVSQRALRTIGQFFRDIFYNYLGDMRIKSKN